MDKNTLLNSIICVEKVHESVNRLWEEAAQDLSDYSVIRTLLRRMGSRTVIQ